MREQQFNNAFFADVYWHRSYSEEGCAFVNLSVILCSGSLRRECSEIGVDSQSEFTNAPLVARDITSCVAKKKNLGPTYCDNKNHLLLCSCWIVLLLSPKSKINNLGSYSHLSLGQETLLWLRFSIFSLFAEHISIADFPNVSLASPLNKSMDKKNNGQQLSNFCNNKLKLLFIFSPRKCDISLASFNHQKVSFIVLRSDWWKWCVV